MYFDCLEHRRKNCNFTGIIRLRILVVSNTQNSIVDSRCFVCVNRIHSGCIVELSVTVHIPFVGNDCAFRRIGFRSIELNLLTGMDGAVRADHGKQVIRLSKPECDINIPALSRLKGSDIPLQTDARIVIIRFIIIVQFTIVGIFPNNIGVMVDTVTVGLLIPGKTVLEPVFIFYPDKIRPGIIPADVVSGISSGNVKVNDFKKADIFQWLIRDIGQLVTDLEISSIFRSNLDFAFNLHFLIHPDNASIIRVILFSTEFLYDTVFSEVLSVMNRSIEPYCIVFPIRGIGFIAVMLENPAQIITTAPYFKIQSHPVVFRPVSPGIAGIGLLVGSRRQS